MIDLTTIYTYDNLGRVVHEDSSDGTTVDYAYNAEGQLACKIVRRPYTLDDTQPIDRDDVIRLIREQSAFVIGGGR